MKVSGTVERDPPIFWDDRGIGLLKLVEHEKPIRIKELQRPELPKDLKPGEKITAEVNEDDRYYSLISLERGEAASPLVPSSSAGISLSQAEQPPTTEDFNIPYSYKQIGPLYPILVDREGNIVDGKHRLAVDPNWRKEIVPWIQSRKDLLMARIHANLHRRIVPKEERQREFTEYANILHADGVAIGELPSTLAELIGFGEGYVRNLLPPTLKLKIRSDAGKKAKFAHLQVGKTQPESLPDAKVPLTEEGFAKTVREAPSGSIDLTAWSCPQCKAEYRIDWKGMKIEPT
ncbi:ParB/RepB/Spo0J family partition protein [Candidatus Bathyarchaeota archaeon]|nr:ParB/RepB/Spo0J family partition protein [Candidatus Bathyarchaeota archaeon]